MSTCSLSIERIKKKCVCTGVEVRIWERVTRGWEGAGFLFYFYKNEIYFKSSVQTRYGFHRCVTHSRSSNLNFMSIDFDKLFSRILNIFVPQLLFIGY